MVVFKLNEHGAFKPLWLEMEQIAKGIIECDHFAQTDADYIAAVRHGLICYSRKAAQFFTLRVPIEKGAKIIARPDHEYFEVGNENPPYWHVLEKRIGVVNLTIGMTVARKGDKSALRMYWEGHYGPGINRW